MNITSRLVLSQLELPIYLGWTETERSQQQAVFIDIYIQFSEPPLACKTDQLSDTYCYDALIKLVKAKIITRTFCLVEHVAYEIYHVVKHYLGSDKHVLINIIKKPPIENLTGGISFHYGDKEVKL